MNKNKERKESKLTSLYAYKQKLSDKLAVLHKEKATLNKVIKQTSEKLGGVVENIKYIEGRGLLISTHFIDRYRERVNAQATEEDIRKHVVTPELLKMLEVLGHKGTYPIKDSTFCVVIDDNKLVTIMEPNKMKKDDR